jgi:large conductance mechanosensitive channel
MKKVEKEKLKNVAGKGKGFIEEFKSFVLKGNVMDMAIGVIIGTAFASIVTALTDDFINPIINSIGGADVKGQLKIWSGQYLNWGHFLTSIINFLIMAFVLFLMLKGVNKLMTINKKKQKDDDVLITKTDEVLLLEEIRDLLKKRK